ncbi:MAG: adenylosuccinate lyase, partial [Minisyncoccales bacterium]
MASDNLTNITPIDGRYQSKIKELSEYFSEYALIKYRVKVEIEYFISLSELKLFSLSQSEKEKLRKIYADFNTKDAESVKEFEKTTNHDVKAVEYFIKSKLDSLKINKNLEYIHFALTSEDINNLSYSLMLKDGIENAYYPVISQIYNEIKKLALENAKLPMLSRTHGQPASPTTLGKEFVIYSKRICDMVDSLKKIKINGKLNGASGNFCAHYVSYPKIDWLKFSKKFILSLGLNPNLVTYQIEPHDSIAEIFHALTRINTVIINFNQDIWTYISQEYIGQKVIKGEVGSSAMPHKVNPIDFENSEGNLGLANAIFEFLARKLPITRLQRDLSDSTVIRNQGTALAYTIIGFKSTLKGLSKIKPLEENIKNDLEKHVEIIAEAIQNILRRENQEMPYEKLKELTRGKKVTI